MPLTASCGLKVKDLDATYRSYSPKTLHSDKIKIKQLQTPQTGSPKGKLPLKSIISHKKLSLNNKNSVSDTFGSSKAYS